MATAKRTRTAKSAKAAKTNSAPEMAKVTTQTIDIQHAIRTRAYSLYEERGFSHGHDFEDWLRAENEIMSHFGARG
jgi:hypothetical protein